MKNGKINQSVLVKIGILGRAPAAQGENAIVKRKSCPKKLKSDIQNISTVKNESVKSIIVDNSLVFEVTFYDSDIYIKSVHLLF